MKYANFLISQRGALPSAAVHIFRGLFASKITAQNCQRNMRLLYIILYRIKAHSLFTHSIHLWLRYTSKCGSWSMNNTFQGGVYPLLIFRSPFASDSSWGEWPAALEPLRPRNQTPRYGSRDRNP